MSNDRTGSPHAGQAEPGETTERPAGTRWTTTLRKDPISSPRTASRLSSGTVSTGAHSPGGVSKVWASTLCSADPSRASSSRRWSATAAGDARDAVHGVHGVGAAQGEVAREVPAQLDRPELVVARERGGGHQEGLEGRHVRLAGHPDRGVVLLLHDQLPRDRHAVAGRAEELDDQLLGGALLEPLGRMAVAAALRGLRLDQVVQPEEPVEHHLVQRLVQGADHRLPGEVHHPVGREIELDLVGDRLDGSRDGLADRGHLRVRVRRRAAVRSPT